MNRKELTRGDYPAAYHSLSPNGERSLASSHLALDAWRTRARGKRTERERRREGRGREEGFSEDPPTRAPTLDGNGMLHESSALFFDARRRSLGEPEMSGVGAMDSGMGLSVVPPENKYFNFICIRSASHIRRSVIEGRGGGKEGRTMTILREEINCKCKIISLQV